MNYQHAFHAGNFADVFKHIMLCRIIEHLKKKDKAFRVIDTHAGAGAYHLADGGTLSANGKPPEWVNGVGKLSGWRPDDRLKDIVAPYLDEVLDGSGMVRSDYPGSPLIALNRLRKQDRITACELHRDAHEQLKSLFEGNFQARVLNLDGWLLPGSQLPPKEKRGLLLIDPPFEKSDDFERMVDAMQTVAKRWSGGTIALWYPLKHADQVSHFHRSLAGSNVSDLVKYEIEIAKPSDPPALHGCGMIVRNGPYTLENEMRLVLPALADLMQRGTGEGNWRIDRVTPE